MSGRVVLSMTQQQASALLDISLHAPITDMGLEDMKKVAAALTKRGLARRTPDGWRLTPLGEAAASVAARLAKPGASCQPASS